MIAKYEGQFNTSTEEEDADVSTPDDEIQITISENEDDDVAMQDAEPDVEPEQQVVSPRKRLRAKRQQDTASMSRTFPI